MKRSEISTGDGLCTLTLAEMQELRKLTRNYRASGLNKNVCASLCRKGLAERHVHSELVRFEGRTSWTEYRLSELGKQRLLLLGA